MRNNTLRFIRTEERYSVYKDRDGSEVMLHHGTGRRLTSLLSLSAEALTAEWTEFTRVHYRYRIPRNQQRVFLTEWLPGRVIEDLYEYEHWVEFCGDCNTVHWRDDTYTVNGTGHRVCESCYSNEYWACASCSQRFSSTSTVEGDNEVCQSCLDNYYRWCDGCDEYYHHANQSDHNHGNNGCCESPETEFLIRNDGNEPLANDTRLSVTLPSGVISEEGMQAIAQYLQQYAMDQFYYCNAFQVGTLEERQEMNEERSKWNNLSYALEKVGPEWQRRDGNFPKRLSRFAYKTQKIKLPPEVISNVGNIASEHSRTTGELAIETTRLLNLPREEFAHSGSCWWSEYAESRCALKTNGGFGLRSFNEYDNVTGRAWVMPLKKALDRYGAETLTPTFETLEPDAFVVFNGYQLLSGYAPARVMAHLAGMTYRKISFSCSPMYVNNESGYLVAPEEIASKYTDGGLCLEVPQHSDLHHIEQINATTKENANA